MATQRNDKIDDLSGNYDCWAASPTCQHVQNTDGERKLIVTVCADLGNGQTRLVDVWLTLDPRLTTDKGKKRIEFTWNSLRGLGATDPAGDVHAALSADRGAPEITINGITGEGAQIATLAITRGATRNFANLYPKRTPVADDFLSALAASAGGPARKKATASSENPFAGAPVVQAPPPRPVMGAPAPAIPQPAALSTATTPAEDTSFDFGANASTPAASEEPASPPPVEPAGSSGNGGSSGKKKKKGDAANVNAE